jgi:hypothetical protein
VVALHVVLAAAAGAAAADGPAAARVPAAVLCAATGRGGCGGPRLLDLALLTAGAYRAALGAARRREWIGRFVARPRPAPLAEGPTRGGGNALVAVAGLRARVIPPGGATPAAGGAEHAAVEHRWSTRRTR